MVVFSRYITVERHSTGCPNWVEDDFELTEIEMHPEGVIESGGVGMLQVDFANRFVGGGVLGHGSVQEEIRFMICPECLISCLVCEAMDDNEAILITGPEQFSKYTGYGRSFAWGGAHLGIEEKDRWGRLDTRIIAIDASIYGHNKGLQYSRHAIDRELAKCFAGFSFPDSSLDLGATIAASPPTPLSRRSLSAVATGNWGCGAFGGDPALKSLLQLIAASAAKRRVVYFAFQDRDLCERVNLVRTLLAQHSVTSFELYRIILEYQTARKNDHNLGVLDHCIKRIATLGGTVPPSVGSDGT